ncbi:helix-turn-helix domain-containing protein [Mesorhizobium sp. B2-1-8]|uniref:helix-turn-helix domain-containing protein n=1 Tax=unclassified Mesorhizobium TaxID=325217 RepID=UPI0015E32CAD|nr:MULTISPECIES: helix-turn-helix transcriptional regulator [unclassified Mesorhizobium]MBZ9671102.1 helix-turn-helix domain-containing protein [Mesorhizobium sp. ES1-3]MBZ9710253.1 helix-turn-helix domain-containing protein [Mesorhizobium sp. ESP7-2]UCI17630.1 helix-turn-helix domain-containing protein [Mesorhizobium sp. B2-1-8]
MSDTTNIFEQSPDFDTFGGRLSRARDASGLSVKELAWQLSVNMSTINAWESDRSQPSSHRLFNITGLLGVSLSWLLHGIGIGPAEDDFESPMDAFSEQLTKLRALHSDTGRLIRQMQQQMEG